MKVAIVLLSILAFTLAKSSPKKTFFAVAASAKARTAHMLRSIPKKVVKNTFTDASSDSSDNPRSWSFF
jgi:hypothetical protein